MAVPAPTGSTETVRSPPSPRSNRDHQIDTCWLVNNGRYAYGANYTSGTISSFKVGRDGSLSLLDSVAGKTDHPGNIQGSTPLDMGVSPNGRYLYVVLPGSGAVGGWQINRDGSLTKLGEFGGLPRPSTVTWHRSISAPAAARPASPSPDQYHVGSLTQLPRTLPVVRARS